MLFMRGLWGLCLASCLSLVTAYPVVGTLNATLELDARVTLASLSSDRIYSTPVLADSTFSIDVPADSYLLRVRSRAHAFHTYSVDVSPDVRFAARIFLPGPAGDVLRAGPSLQVAPFRIQPLAPREYFDKPADFDLVRIVKSNPLMLLLGVGAILSMGMPMIMKHLDPEILQEVTANQQQYHNKIASFQNMDVTGGLSKFLATPGGSASDGETRPLEPDPQTVPRLASSKPSGGGNGKARKKR